MTTTRRRTVEEKVVGTTEVNGVTWEVTEPRVMPEKMGFGYPLRRYRIADIKGQYTINRLNPQGNWVKTERREVFASLTHGGFSEKVLSEKFHDPKEALAALGMDEFQMWSWASRFELDLSPRKEVVKDRTDRYYVCYHLGDPKDWSQRRQSVRSWPAGDRTTTELAEAEEWLEKFLYRFAFDPDSLM